MKIYECVPNVSEGRDPAVLDACAAAIEAAGAEVAHRTSDSVHHRSVFTFFGTRDVVLGAAVTLARECCERIDLRAHAGVHPRIGALDVLPFVPFGDATLEDAADVAREAARRLWLELGVPCFLYGAAAARPERMLLAHARGRGFEDLATRPDGPDVGTVRAHASAGATAVGARRVLAAFNVVLATGDVALARRIARTIRERDGGLRGVRALGLDLGDGRVQVSCNLTDVAATPPDRIVAVVAALAAPFGVAVAGTETIGLLPRAALAGIVARRLGIEALPGWAEPTA